MSYFNFKVIAAVLNAVGAILTALEAILEVLNLPKQ